MSRLFETVYILLNKKSATAQELADHFGVSRRTIYRDVDALGLAGIPVVTEKGRGGGIALMPSFVLDKALLSDGEQAEILCAMRALSGIKAQGAGGTLQKLSAIFKKNAQSWLEADFSEWGNDDDAFDGFKAAILESRIAEFDYCDADGSETSRRVEPVCLLFKHKAWYAKCFCLARQDLRLFKLARVSRLKITDARFAARDFPENDDESDAPKKPDLCFKLKIAPEMAHRAREEFGGSAQAQADGGFVVSATYPEDDWLYGYVLSFGEHAEALEPERLREIIREKAERIAARYRRE
ncbi:MAG: YafY family transcriptional regulator [Treponema sp.]|nr:YafY family transcriptional regulator [Treponema sp.]